MNQTKIKYHKEKISELETFLLSANVQLNANGHKIFYGLTKYPNNEVGVIRCTPEGKKEIKRTGYYEGIPLSVSLDVESYLDV